MASHPYRSREGALSRGERADEEVWRIESRRTEHPVLCRHTIQERKAGGEFTDGAMHSDFYTGKELNEKAILQVSSKRVPHPA